MEYYWEKKQAVMVASGSGKRECRTIGQRLRSFRSTVDPEMEYGMLIQAALADLMGEESGLLMPLKDLFSRPRLLGYDFQGGIGSATILRDGLVIELEAYYTKEVVAALCDVLNGYLGIEEAGSTSNNHMTASDSHLSQTRLTSISGSRNSQAGRRDGRSNEEVQQEGEESPYIKNRIWGSKLRIGQDKLLILAAVVIAFSTIAWKTSLICQVFNYCPEYMATQTSKNDLDEAQKSLEAAKLAGSLDALETISGRLDRLVTTLRQQPLTSAQRKALGEIESSYKDLSRRLESEKVNGSLIRKGMALVEAANAEQDKQRENLINEAKKIFESIKLVESSILISDFAKFKQSINGEPAKEKQFPAEASAPAYVEPVRTEAARYAPVTPAPVRSASRAAPARPAPRAPTRPAEGSTCDESVYGPLCRL